MVCRTAPLKFTTLPAKILKSILALKVFEWLH